MEGAEKLKSIRQIGSIVQATQTLPPWCLHSWILLHYVSDWSICHGEKGNCNGTRRGKAWIMDGYYWELNGENSSITRQEAIEIVHFSPFLFQWFPGFRDALYLLFSALNLQQSPHFAGPMLCTDLYVQLMLWFQCSCIIAGTERWFITSEHCVSPMHKRKTKKAARTASCFLEFWMGIKHAHNDPNHNELQKTCECPCTIRPGSLLDYPLGSTRSKPFPNGWNPCCCPYRLSLHQQAEQVTLSKIRRGAAQNSKSLCEAKETSLLSIYPEKVSPELWGCDAFSVHLCKFWGVLS